MPGKVELTYLEILSEGPKFWHEIDADTRTWDYDAVDMGAGWKSLLNYGAVRECYFRPVGCWKKKWCLTMKGKRLAKRWI